MTARWGRAPTYVEVNTPFHIQVCFYVEQMYALIHIVPAHICTDGVCDWAH